MQKKNKNKNKKYLSTYELMKSKYPYSFSDSIGYKGAKFAGTGLKEPKIAGDYALELFNIAKKLIENNYEIIDCLATFTDDEGCSYGEMELVKNGKQTSEGIKKWNDYYLLGEGRYRREEFKDLISDCTLNMKLKHIEGRPFLSVDSYHITNDTIKKKIIKSKYKLYHSICGAFDFKTGEFVKCNRGAWVPRKSMQLPKLKYLK